MRKLTGIEKYNLKRHAKKLGLDEDRIDYSLKDYYEAKNDLNLKAGKTREEDIGKYENEDLFNEQYRAWIYEQAIELGIIKDNIENENVEREFIKNENKEIEREDHKNKKDYKKLEIKKMDDFIISLEKYEFNNYDFDGYLLLIIYIFICVLFFTIFIIF